jgi:hypothetical protein
VENCAAPGHWEGDLLTGANDTNIATLVERHSRFTMLVRLARMDSATVVAALAQMIGTLPEELRRSLTWDQNKEMARHKSFTVATDLQVYFCDPRSPWQRGSSENTNALLRQNFPEKPTSPMSRRTNSTPSPCGSISDPEKPWTSKRRPIGYRRCCDGRLNVLAHSGRLAGELSEICANVQKRGSSRARKSKSPQILPKAESNVPTCAISTRNSG